MKKLRKALRTVLLVIVALIVVIVIAINLFTNRALKIGIETVATDTLGVSVKVDNVSLSILRGKLGLKNLLINNPPGYKHDKLLILKNGRVAVDIKSLLSDTVNIKEIKLDGMEVVIEQKGITSNNLKDVLNNIPGKEETKEQPEAPGKKLHIDTLEITNVTAKVKLLPVPGKKDTVTLKLDPIIMNDLGADNKLDTAVLTSKILVAITTGIAKQGAGLLPDDILDSMNSQLKKLGHLSGELLKDSTEILKKGTDVGKDIIKDGKDIGRDVTEGLKGLFKKKKE